MIHVLFTRNRCIAIHSLITLTKLTERLKQAKHRKQARHLKLAQQLKQAKQQKYFKQSKERKHTRKDLVSFLYHVSTIFTNDENTVSFRGPL